MTNEQAIKTLKEQIESLRSVDERTYKTWHTQTKSEIKQIFSAISDEYFFLNSFSLFDQFPDTSITMQLLKNKITATDFLQRCIQTIERSKPVKAPDPVIQYRDKIVQVIKEVEVIKEVLVYPPKVNAFRAVWNWIKRKDIIGVIGLTITVLFAVFWAGWYFGENKADIQNVDLKRDNKQLIKDTASLGAKNRELLDSIRIKSTLNVTNDKADNNTNGNQSKVSPDSTKK